MGGKRNKFRGDLWIMLIMGFLLLWVVLAHEVEGYKKIVGEIKGMRSFLLSFN